MHRTDLRDDSGFALVAVITAAALITAIAIAGFFLATESYNTSNRVTAEARAYQAASTGLDRALAVYSDASVFPQTGELNGDTYVVQKITWSGANQDYELVSTGRSGATTETVRVRFTYFDLWDMNIAGADNSHIGSGAGFNGNGTIIGKIYANGDFSWTGSAELLGGPVFVRNGTFNRQSSGNTIGTASDPIQMYLDNVPSGVSFDSSGQSITNGVDAVKAGSPPKFDIPWVTNDDLANYLQAAKDQSDVSKGAPAYTGAVRPTNADATYYKWIHGNTTFNSAFGTPGVSGDSLAIGADGTLWINGVVYVDGSLTIGTFVQRYHGSGILVARDGVVINGRLVPDQFPANALFTETIPTATSSITAPRVVAGNALGIITPGEVVVNGTHGVGDTASSWDFTGAVFSNGAFRAPNTGTAVRGSLISGGIMFDQPNGYLVTQPGLKSALPQGMPALEGFRAEGDWVRQ